MRFLLCEGNNYVLYSDGTNVEKVNDTDETVEAATEDDDKVTDKKVDSADVSEKDTAAKSDESA